MENEIKPGDVFLVKDFEHGKRPVWVKQINPDGTIDAAYSDGNIYVFAKCELEPITK